MEGDGSFLPGALARLRRLGGLSAAGIVPPGAADGAEPEHRHLPRWSASTPRRRTDLSAPLDWPPVRHPRAAVGATRRTRDRLLREPSPEDVGVRNEQPDQPVATGGSPVALVAATGGSPVATGWFRTDRRKEPWQPPPLLHARSRIGPWRCCAAP